jgi:hypothetical protein
MNKRIPVGPYTKSQSRRALMRGSQSNIRSTTRHTYVNKIKKNIESTIRHLADDHIKYENVK